MRDAELKLRAIKVIHTVVWAIFASAIVAIPITAWLGAFQSAFILIGIVSAECVVLMLNGMKCPLTSMTARYTENRADNFDIYLPLWLARYNREIFGPLFVAGIVFLVVCWLH